MESRACMFDFGPATCGQNRVSAEPADWNSVGTPRRTSTDIAFAPTDGPVVLSGAGRSPQEHHQPLFRGRYDSIASAEMRRSAERVTYETVSTAINATGSRNKGLSPAR